MSQLTSVLGLEAFDPIVRILALALPVLALLTLMFVLKSQSKARQRSKPDHLQMFDAGLSTGQSVGSAAPANSIPPPQRDVSAPTVSRTLSAIGVLQSRLSEAQVSGPKPMLAQLYLELAGEYRKAGDEAASLESLRSAAGLAAKHGPPSTHAEARLQLAEAAFQAGDLTGACEQWQMARMALHEAGQQAAQARVDQRMRDNGCPTDWVLTDF
jgi:tetratricopeptide (TPR) repeat protein